MFVNPVQNWKEDFPMLATEFPIITLPIVFANRFISTIYVLNGRKVMTCILKKLKKKKI